MNKAATNDIHISVNKAVFYKTGSIFSEIVGRELKIKFVDDKITPYSDEFTIYLPIVKSPPIILDENDLYTVLEHELAHHVFGTDYKAAKKWAEEKYPEVKDVAFKIWEILEDQRVESLWGQLYEGSLHRFKIIRSRLINRDTKNLIEVLIAARGKRFDLIPPVYIEFAKAFTVYLKNVENCGPEASFILAERIMNVILSTSSLLGPKKLAYTGGYSLEYTLKAVEEVKDDLLSSAQKAALKELLEKSKEEAKARLEEINELLKKMQRAYYKPRYVEEEVSAETQEVRSPIREDITLANKLAQILKTVIYKKYVEPEPEGIEIDIDEYIQWKVHPMIERKLFSDEDQPQKFICSVLLDLSLSMSLRYGFYSDSYNTLGFYDKLGLAKRAATVLALAFKQIRNVEFRVYGFSGRSDDLMVLVREAKSVLDIQKLGTAEGWGLTPLHLAINIVVERLRKERGKKLLFVITDGAPEASIYGKPIDQDWLIKWTREAVKNAIDKGIQIYTIMIDPSISEELMHVMFGSSERWTLIRDKDKLKDVMLKYVAKHVTRMIRKSR
ncbi:MAG: hypothetical protein ACTSSJ_02750 [Candidatus Odinarchaeia archaeon]